MNTVIAVDVSDTGVVTNIVGKLLSGITPYASVRDHDPFRDGTNHEELAAGLQEKMLASIIIDRDPLDPSLADDPKYTVHKTNIIISEVHEEARRRMINRYMPLERADELIALFELETKLDNHSGKSLRGKLQDGLFAAEELALFSEIIESKRQDFEFIYNEDTDELTQRPNWKEDWPTELLRILGPRTVTEMERVYSLPKPFDHWDSRNRFQQWYLAGNSFEDGYFYLRGGSGSSGARLHQGLGAHTFALLASQGKAIPTWHLRYTSKNELVLVEKFEDFRAVDRELTGNYQVNYRDTRHLFEGRLITLPEMKW